MTHDQGEALSLADQVAIMADGALVQVGTPAEVYLSPVNSPGRLLRGHAALLDASSGRRIATCALGGVTVRGVVSPGPVRLALRSEQVIPTRASESAPHAVVEDVSFFGHDATIRVRLSSGARITARIPVDVIPEPGERIGLRVLGEVLAFPREAGR